MIIQLLIALIWTSPLHPIQKELAYANKIYENEIRSVQLYNATGEDKANLRPAVTQIGQGNLMLEFDDLRNDYNSYYVRIIHCNYDWTPSTLNDLDFMEEFNEFNVNDYAFSSNTDIPYVHYRFKLPSVKLPGNYLLAVYRDGNKADLILSHRFMVFDPKTRLMRDRQSSGSLTLQSTNQQLNFTIDYNGTELINPMGTVHVVIRQNQRWDNSKLDVKPSFIREDIHQIEYRLFDNDKYFSAGNEFRFVDFRSINFPGQFTDRIDKSVKPYHLWVQPDLSRQHTVYSQYPDLNGQYRIENLDNGQDETGSNYIHVTFTLKSEELKDARVFVVGAFNQWARDASNQMLFDPANNAYQATCLLKQGRYDYQYLVESDTQSTYLLEGSHFETENFYEVFFYYRPFRPNADLLIGYFPMAVNPR